MEQNANPRLSEYLSPSAAWAFAVGTSIGWGSLVIMISNYSFMNKQSQETEKIANTDAMTGVKNKHAYLVSEQEINSLIQRGKGGEFAVWSAMSTD